MNDFWTTFFYIVVMVAVLIAAYLTTKFISGRAQKTHKGRFINFLDRLPMGKDKNIILIEVGGHNFLVGVTNQSISVLGQVDGGELKNAQETKNEPKSKGFVSQLRNFLINAKNTQENLRKARAGSGVNKRPSVSRETEDLLDMMEERIRSRRERMENGGDEK